MIYIDNRLYKQLDFIEKFSENFVKFCEIFPTFQVSYFMKLKFYCCQHLISVFMYYLMFFTSYT
jgi:hypothetical protein